MSIIKLHETTSFMTDCKSESIAPIITKLVANLFNQQTKISENEKDLVILYTTFLIIILAQIDNFI